MKFTTVLCAFLVLACVCFQANAICHIHGEDRPVGFHQYKCAVYQCHENGDVTSKGCALSECAEGKQIGYKDTENDKPYPECCARPICAD